MLARRATFLLGGPGFRVEQSSSVSWFHAIHLAIPERARSSIGRATDS
jgi:hypothetical protein